MSDDTKIEKIDLDNVDWRGSREFFESLGEALDKLDDKDEAYDFTWVGKRKAIVEAGAPINQTFRPDVEASKNWDTTGNLFIEGDNLDALKLLQESYLGKVKMIYIDPPYNTGKDFVYRDNFKANVNDYDQDTEYKDEAGNINFKKNEKTNGRYHSDWLSMMYPRLKLARNLLTEDGVIFMSIDDNEAANLKKMCDEIYGEDNFVAQLSVQLNPRGRNLDKFIAKTHESVLVFVKDYLKESSIVGVEKTGRMADEYNRKDGTGQYRLTGLRNRNQAFNDKTRPGLYYPLYVNKDTRKVSIDKSSDYTDEVWPDTPDGIKTCWTWGKEKTVNENNLLTAEKTGSEWRIFRKDYLIDESGKATTTLVKSVWFDKEINNDYGRKVIKDLFGSSVMSFPKAVDLIKKLIQIGTSKNSTVIDFFSGSSTTAHAVMQLNAEDSGSRKHIQVQLAEEAEENSEAYKAGYKTIPEISRERICRAGDKIKEDFKDELAKRETPIDTGFRALTITDTNYKDVHASAEEHRQESLLGSVDNIKDDRSDLDLLFGVLTRSALELNRPIEKREISGADTYIYDYLGESSGLIACFAKKISEKSIKEIARLNPLTAVFRDSSFENSQSKVNLAEHFRIISPTTKVKVI